MANGAAGRAGNNWVRIVGWGFMACLLMVPLVAMQFTREVDWSPFDFIVMGVLLALVGGAFELTARLSRNWAYRAGAAIAILTSFLLVWINLAVGFIGSEDNPLNLVYVGVLGAWMSAAVISRFRPAGMAVGLALAAALQAGIGLFALVAGEGGLEPPGAVGLLLLNLVFAGAWALAAALFRSAAGPA